MRRDEGMAERQRGEAGPERPGFADGELPGPPDPETPFENDLEYIRHLLARDAARRAAAGTALTGEAAEGGTDGAAAARLREEAGRLETAIRSKLERSREAGFVPRLVRLAGADGLDEAERRVFEFLVTATLSGSGPPTVPDLLRFAGFDLSTVARFLLPSRPHMLEEAVTLTGDTGSLFSSAVGVADEIVKLVAGAPLAGAELLMLTDTTAEQVLAAEEDPPGVPWENGTRFGQLEAILEAEFEGALARNGGEPGDGGPVDGERPDPGEPAAPSPSPLPGEDLGPYTSDLEYLEDCMAYIRARVRRIVGWERSDDPFSDEPQRPVNPRQLQARERLRHRRYLARMKRTRAAGGWLPRMEELAERRGLDEFEKWVLLTLVGHALHLGPDGAWSGLGPTIDDMLHIWTDGLEERVLRRRHFYRTGKLVEDGLVHLETGLMGELTGTALQIDRAVLDHVVGLEAESASLVDGSRLYRPAVTVDRVILPEETKRLILDTVASFDAYREARRATGLDETLVYGRGIVMLFHGPSGTGKTMMANALANHLGKRLMLVNFPSLGFPPDDALRSIFQAARIHDAVLFFDECEEIFASRDAGNVTLSMLLTEIERHDGLTVMATNRPFVLDEAMHRRITLAIEFPLPDRDLRRRIWERHIPPEPWCAPGLDTAGLAERYELSGGLIKNAVISALSFAASRDPERPVVALDDLERGARLQLRGNLQRSDLDRGLVPSTGLDGLVLPDGIHRTVLEIVQFEKARRTLNGSWGFGNGDGRGAGLTALFHGPPGTGKSFTAEAIAYETGKPLRVVNVAELLSKWVGETAQNIEALFTGLRSHEAVLVFEEAEGLFASRTTVSSSSDRYANMDVGLLLHHMERYPGVVILTSNMIDAIDRAFMRRMRYIVEFPPPDEALRERLWARLVPDRVPLDPGVDFGELARRFVLTGGEIRNAVYRAAARAALRTADRRRVTMADLLAAASEEVTDVRTPVGFTRAE